LKFCLDKQNIILNTTIT